MAGVSFTTKDCLSVALCDASAANDVINRLNAAVGTATLTVTATTGSLPTPDGSVTVANAATPTVSELLEFCMELRAQLETIRAALD